MEEKEMERTYVGENKLRMRLMKERSNEEGMRCRNWQTKTNREDTRGKGSIKYKRVS